MKTTTNRNFNVTKQEIEINDKVSLICGSIIAFISPFAIFRTLYAIWVIILGNPEFAIYINGFHFHHLYAGMIGLIFVVPFIAYSIREKYANPIVIYILIYAFFFFAGMIVDDIIPYA